jgi:hypothetical protein
MNLEVTAYLILAFAILCELRLTLEVIARILKR